LLLEDAATVGLDDPEEISSSKKRRRDEDEDEKFSADGAKRNGYSVVDDNKESVPMKKGNGNTKRKTNVTISLADCLVSLLSSRRTWN
jgi:hypothetical protein